MTKRKELTNEPLDDQIPLERPGLLFNAWKRLVDKGKLPEMDSDETLGISIDVLRDHIGRETEAKVRATPLVVPISGSS